MNNIITHKPELLIPAGSFERFKTALLYGADAVYCGTPLMSLRIKSKFSIDEVRAGVELAHNMNKKVYLTVNLFAHNHDLEKLPEYVKVLKEINPDGAIVADVAVFRYLRENLPQLNLHVSTQSNICSWLGVQFWQDLGAKMCVLARELSINEIKEIRNKCPNIKLETFIHGSMCMAYSGRCLLSNYLAHRDANRGNCAHSCRWNYRLHLKLKDGTIKELNINENNKDLFDFLMVEEFRAGDVLEITELENMSHILNSKDLCLLPKLGEYISAGVDCFKIEGRNKTQYYVAMVANAYRKAIDDWLKNSENWNYQKYLEELYSISNRGFSLAFANQKPTELANNYDEIRSISEYDFAGYVSEIHSDYLEFFIKNRTDKDDEVEFISPTAENKTITLQQLIDSNNNSEEQFISGGLDKKIKIPFEWFKMSKSEIEKGFPVLTVARKKRNLTAQEKARIELDKEAYRIELGYGSEEKHKKLMEELQKILINNI